MSINVTYLLGAGASASRIPNTDLGFLPLTKEIPERLDLLIRHIRDKIKLIPNSNKWNDFITDLEWLQDESSKHASIDTFAKKLYLKDKYDDLKRLKKTLSIFFSIIQKQAKGTDPRYDAFWASVLEKGTQGHFKLPNNIKILTWNYDVQLELSYNAYAEKNEFIDIQEELLSIPSQRETQTGIKEPNIIHLNGLAGLRTLENNILTPFFPLNEVSDIISDFQEYIKIDKNAFEDSFTFSWESAKYVAETGLRYARDIAANTEYLVVIGYSFPFFNRKVDKQIIEAMPKLKKIYFQDPVLDGSFLKAQFKLPVSPVPGSHNSTAGISIEPIKDTDKFFLPHEL